MKTAGERNRERLCHIREAIEKIEAYTDGLDASTFTNDPKTNEAVLFQLSIIGEAIIHVEDGLLGKYEYPWHQVRALRNVIAHEYFGIRLDKIWLVVQKDIPGLKRTIEQMMKKEF